MKKEYDFSKGERGKFYKAFIMCIEYVPQSIHYNE